MTGTYARKGPTATGVRTRSRLHVVLWVVIGYVAYVAACFAIEAYARHRFQVQRKAEVERVVERRARLLAEARRSSNLREMEGWTLYKAYRLSCVALWGILSVATAVATYRSLRARGGTRVLGVKVLALAVGLPALIVFLVGIGPPEEARELWEGGFALF